MINIIYNNGTTDIYLDQLVKSVTWSGDIQQAARSLQVEMTNTLDGKTRAFIIEKGRELRLLNNGAEIFRGVIFADRINARGQLSLTAYDENIYLTKSQDTKKFVSKKASDIVKSLCADFGIPVGTVHDTGYVIPKLILKDKTLWDMMVTALTVSQKQNGNRFWITSQGGKLQLLERKTQAVQWVLENGTNIIDASYSQSIEDMRTQVKVVGGDGDKKEIIATVKNDALITKFGIMQHLENADSDLNKSQIEQLAKQLLKDLGTIDDEATLEAIGIPDVYSGKAVYVREALTGIVGSYYVTADTHTFEGGTHKMSLTLSFTDNLPKLEYETPPEDKKKSPKRKKSDDDGATSLDSVLKEIDQLGG